jgi:hypothetical protein
VSSELLEHGFHLFSKETPSVTSTQDSNGVLEAILRFNKDRKPKLVRLKLRLMLADPFTFFRGRILRSHFAGAIPRKIVTCPGKRRT